MVKIQRKIFLRRFGPCGQTLQRIRLGRPMGYSCIGSTLSIKFLSTLMGSHVPKIVWKFLQPEAPLTSWFIIIYLLISLSIIRDLPKNRNNSIKTRIVIHFFNYITQFCLAIKQKFKKKIKTIKFCKSYFPKRFLNWK